MKVEKKYHLMKILACAAVILPVILIARYNRPCADDYAYTYMTHNALEQGAGIPGLIKAALDTDIKYYNSWQGLYTSAFVMALTPSVFGETYYVLCTYIILASVFLPLFFCIRMVGKSCGTSGQAGLPALFVTVYLALCMPSATQGLFWYNGAVNYISFTMLAVFNIILTCSLYCQNRDVSYAVRHMTAIVCSFVISGGNHVSAFANILILAMLTVCFASRRKFCGVMPLISGLAGFLVMYLAPGTAARQSVLAQSSIGKTVWMCGFHAVDAICSWMDLNYFVFLLVCVPSVYRLTRNVVYRVRKRDFLFLACAMYATVSGMFCAPYYASSSFGAGRLVNAVWIVFTFFSVAGLAAAVVYVRQHVGGGCVGMSDGRMRTGQKAWNLLFLSGCLLFFWNPGFSGTATGRTCAQDILEGRAGAFAKEMDLRIEAFRDPDVKEIAVYPLSETAVSSVLHFSDLSADPAGYPNAHITMYYGKIVTLAQ